MRSAQDGKSSGAIPSVKPLVRRSRRSGAPQPWTVTHDDPATAARIASKRPSPQFGMIDFAGEYKGWRVLLNPLGCYYGFIVAVGILTVFGIIMVFSSSSVDMVAAGSSPWAKALNQVGFSVVGLVLALVAAHCKGRTLKWLALPMYLVSVAVQVFTFFFGIDVGGNRGWLRIAGIQFQPAEFMKFTICLWFPLVMISMMRLKPGIRQSWKAWDLGDWGRTFGLYVLGLGSVLLGKDLGTALVIILIGLMAIVASGFPMKYVGLVGIAAVVGVAILTVFSSNRMSRIMAITSTYATKPPTRTTRWPPAVCWVWGSAIPARSGTTCLPRITTSSSPSLARRRVLWVPHWWCCSSWSSPGVWWRWPCRCTIGMPASHCCAS